MKNYIVYFLIILNIVLFPISVSGAVYKTSTFVTVEYTAGDIDGNIVDTLIPVEISSI